jgi:putative membrane protein
VLSTVDLTPINFFTRAGFHPLWTVLVVAAALWYPRAVRRVRDAGGVWPQWRTWLFLGGVVIVAGATLSGLTWWNATSFTVPAIRRVMLLMIAPFPLLLAAPLHLALESGSPRTQRAVRAVVDSRLAALLTTAPAAWILYAGWLGVFYGTGFYGVAARHEFVGELVDVVFLLVGLIFLTPAIGEDLPPRRMAPLTRCLFFLVSLPVHTIVGMALESQGKVPSPGLSLNDVHNGGGVIWTAGELISILCTIAMLVLWSRLEERGAKDRDATDDATAAAQAAAWRLERRIAAAHAAATRAGIVAELARADHVSHPDRLDAVPSRVPALEAEGGSPVGAAAAEPSRDHPR